MESRASQQPKRERVDGLGRHAAREPSACLTPRVAYHYALRAADGMRMAAAEHAGRLLRTGTRRYNRPVHGDRYTTRGRRPRRRVCAARFRSGGCRFASRGRAVCSRLNPIIGMRYDGRRGVDVKNLPRIPQVVLEPSLCGGWTSVKAQKRVFPFFNLQFSM